MSRSRDSTTFMDYEWDNQKGPVDQSSPFITAVPQPKKRKLNSFASKIAADVDEQQLNSGLPFGHSGSHTALESPSKNSFATPNRPRLRDPHNEHFLFSQQSKPLPSIPSHIQDNWAPRTPPNIVDCSSGGETPNTPAFEDSDAGATPDTHIAQKMGRLMEGETDRSPKKGRRQSIFSKFTSRFSSSPSPVKDDSARAYSRKAENRVMKKRSKARKATVRDDYDSDAEGHNKGGAQQQSQPGMAVGVAGFFSWIEAHPNLPSVLSFYLQLLVNLFLGCAFMYVLYAAWRGIMNDVSIESHKSMVEIMVEIGACAKDYNENRCAPETRVPAMEMICSNWEKCMQRDPKKVARASVTARTFAMIFNSFVEEFSYKSMVFLAFLVLLSLVFFNLLFIYSSRRMQYNRNQPVRQFQARESSFDPQLDPAPVPLIYQDTNPQNGHPPGIADPIYE